MSISCGRLAVVFALILLLSGCAPTPAPTPTAVPTYTPQPPYTPNPTLTPLPTYTPWPTLTPYPTATPTATPLPTLTPTPTRTPLPTVPPPTATAVRYLDVEFNTVHYNCQKRCLADRGNNWDPGMWAYAYRTFHVNLRVANLTKDRTLAAKWGPYFVVTDGVNEWRRTETWYWYWEKGPFSWWGQTPVSWILTLSGPQPDVTPGAVVNFTFTHFIPRPGLWVKEVGLEAWGQTYRQALDLNDAKANGNYVDCGEVFSRACPGGQLPLLPY